MSLLATVAQAISAPEDVDITAASAAASTSPRTPTGSSSFTIVANAASALARFGYITLAAVPMTAPAMAYTRQYVPATVPPHRAVRSLRAVKTRCQMSCPMSMPKV
ncbi:hypothetical protein SMICM17S_05952 [Streptomyces microflavus]